VQVEHCLFVIDSYSAETIQVTSAGRIDRHVDRGLAFTYRANLRHHDRVVDLTIGIRGHSNRLAASAADLVGIVVVRLLSGCTWASRDKQRNDAARGDDGGAGTKFLLEPHVVLPSLSLRRGCRLQRCHLEWAIWRLQERLRLPRKERARRCWFQGIQVPRG